MVNRLTPLPRPRTRSICYSPSAETRANFVCAARTRLGDAIDRVVYLAPRKFLDDARARLPVPGTEVRFLAYEDVTKSNDLLNAAHDSALLVLDRPSRYKVITTETFVRLSRASALYQHKLLVDILPFTSDLSFLYCPLALLDRGILGYQHWYSFRENNLEMLPDGRQMRAHDVSHLARKLAPHAYLEGMDYLARGWQTISCPLEASERQEYQALRDDLFATHSSGGPIVTALADWTNIRPSRYARLREVLAEAGGQAVVYTNLAGHNRRLSKALPGVEVKSFYDTNGDEGRYDLVVLFELPIVKSYLFFDVLANVRPDCRVILFRGDTTVDTLLYSRLEHEWRQCDAFVQALQALVAESGHGAEGYGEVTA